MPIHPIGEEKRKGTLGSYYSVKDYKAVNPEFGSLDEFKSLVKMIHKMGMYVIIDWVANHTAWDNEWIIDYPEFYTKDSLGNIISPNPDWTDVADLNFENKELRSEMIDALKFWVEECDIDGYRCDVAGMVPIDFWIEARTELQKIKNVFMLAEWDTPEVHLAFDMTYDWNLHNIMNGIAKNEKTVLDLTEHLEEERKRFFRMNAFRMQFTSNHDENSWNGTVFERLGDGAETFAVLTCVIPDMPLVYTGQEAGNAKRLSFFEKDTVEWKEYELFDIYSKLFELKKNKSLLNGDQGGKMIFLESTNKENIFAFTRTSDKDKILAIFNLSEKPLEFELTGESLQGSYKNYFTGKLESFVSKEIFKLNPCEYRIYTK